MRWYQNWPTPDTYTHFGLVNKMVANIRKTRTCRKENAEMHTDGSVTGRGRTSVSWQKTVQSARRITTALVM
jgi:hypothetical protein